MKRFRGFFPLEEEYERPAPAGWVKGVTVLGLLLGLLLAVLAMAVGGYEGFCDFLKTIR